MELAKVKKRYRHVAQYLRKARADVHSRRAEAELIAVLTLGDRLETELALVRYAEKVAHGRLTRAVELLAGLVLGTFAARAHVLHEFARLKPLLTAEAIGFDLTHVLDQLEEEFARLQARGEAIEERLRGLARVATDHLEQFLRAAQAGRSLAGARGDASICAEDSGDQR